MIKRAMAKVNWNFTKATCRSHLAKPNFLLHFKVKNDGERTSKNSKR